MAENGDALDSSNAYVEAYGLPLERFQAWRAQLEREVETDERDARSLIAIPDNTARNAKLVFPRDAFGAPEDG